MSTDATGLFRKDRRRPIGPHSDPSHQRRELSLFSLMLRHQPTSTLFPYTTLFRSPQSPDRQGHRTAVDPWLRDRERSEEHTSELQSRRDLVCRLLLEKKNICRRSKRVIRQRSRAPSSLTNGAPHPAACAGRARGTP